MNKKILKYATIILMIDQVSKGLIGNLMKIGESRTIIKNVFNIHYINNYGAAWGILRDNSYLIIIFTIIAFVFIYRYMYTFAKNNRNNLAFGLLTGGIVGNLLDRVFLGYVRDFFDVYIFGYDFPVFNIADMAIVCGVVLLIVAILKGEDEA